MVNRLSTHLGNVCLDNPVIPAEHMNDAPVLAVLEMHRRFE